MIAKERTVVDLLYVHVTVNRDNLRVNNQQDASSIQNFYFVTKLYMFRASSVPIVRSYFGYLMHLVGYLYEVQLTCWRVYPTCKVLSLSIREAFNETRT
jgi:hypothetical protein